MGFVLAVGLAAVGVWLVVTGTSQKSLRLGALAALWGLLLGTFAMYGSRRGAAPAVTEAPAPESAGQSTEVAVRAALELETLSYALVNR